MRTKLSLLFFFGVFCASLLIAQEFRATISGHVLDPSNAAVPAATITAVNAGTGETNTATTDAAGVYSIPLLRPGQYSVRVSAPGFKQYTQESLTVEVGRTVGLNNYRLKPVG
jgi:hypothetical protein